MDRPVVSLASFRHFAVRALGFATAASACWLLAATSCLAQPGAGLSEPGARPTPVAMPAVHKPAKADQDVQIPPEDAPLKVRELARAKVLSRLGRDADAQKLYMELARTFPQDQDVTSDMAEHFLEKGDAFTALAWLKEIDTPEKRLKRLEARACMAGGKPTEAAVILETLIRETPSDATLRIDLASAYSDMGDPVLAASAARAAVDLDPENAEIRRYAQELNATLRPRAQASFQSYRQGRDSVITTSAVSGQTPLVGRLNLTVKAQRVFAAKRNTGQSFRNITATRTDSREVTTSETVTETDPDTGQTIATVFSSTEVVQTQTDVFLGTVIQGGQPAIAQALDAYRMSLLWLGPKGLEVEAGLNAFWGNGGAFGQFGAVRFSPWKAARVSLDASRNNPWYDPPEASIRQGAYDQARFQFEYVHKERSGLTLEGSATRYSIYGGVPYADRLSMTAVLSRRILASPELWLAYSFSPAVLAYRQGPQAFLLATDTQPTFSRPISLATNEAIHQVSANFVWKPKSWLQAGLYAGFGQDLFRNEPFVFASPTLLMNLWDSLEWESRAEYRNETRFLQNGGESLLLFTAIRICL